MEAGDRRSLGLGAGPLARAAAYASVYLSGMSDRGAGEAALPDARPAPRRRRRRGSGSSTRPKSPFDELPFNEITLAAIAEAGRGLGADDPAPLRQPRRSLHGGAGALDRRRWAATGTSSRTRTSRKSSACWPTTTRSSATGSCAGSPRRTATRPSACSPTLGRAFHLEWCKEAFAPALKGLRGERRERRAFQFAALTDIYVWKILRRDRGLSPEQTKLAMREMIEPLTERSR